MFLGRRAQTAQTPIRAGHVYTLYITNMFPYIYVFVLNIVLLKVFCSSVHVEMSDYKDHPCKRSCSVNASMMCEYNFTVESYFTLTKACFHCPFNVTDCQRPHCIPANGVSRPVLTVNRMLPGPAIHVCEHDTVIVNVHNKLQGAEGITLHWHGILQNGTPYMDGVGMVTQCPINAHTSFQYRFSAGNAGTHYWHDHTGPQRSDGLFGPLIVRQAPARDVHYDLYDYDLPEHAIVIHDWLLDLSVHRFTAHLHGTADIYPASLLINGKGAYRSFKNDSTGETAMTPYETLRMEAGKRYRVRIISNGILNCPIQFSIDNHTLKAIASDGHPFKPVEVESINFFAGERYDVVVTADQNVDNYWIRIRGLGDCSFKNASQLAILRYNGAPEKVPRTSTDYSLFDRQGKRLNPWNHAGTVSLVPVSDLEALDTPDKSITIASDKKFYLSMDFTKINNYHFNHPYLYPNSGYDDSLQTVTPQINHISMTIPSSPPLSQFTDIMQSEICNDETVTTNCTEELCECLHLIKVDLNDTVELIVIDEGKYFDANHPMHLHGHSFRVVGMDRLGSTITRQDVEDLDRAGKIRRNLVNPVVKDTVTIPDGGYTVIRLFANNPGFWFFHCHVELHVDIGMGLILQVGELSQMGKMPHNFPQCGSWKIAT